MTKSTTKTVEETYTKMSSHEHVLKKPNTYIGSIEPDEIEIWINNSEGKMEYKKITYVPGLYKIYDEILVNAHDHAMRPNTNCKTIKVNIDKEKGEISVWNDGDGIPVQKHSEYKMYIPEMIFGYLRTSSNYTEGNRFWGGTNGFGAKLPNIYSKDFYVETVDVINKKKYIQHNFHS